MKNLFSCLFIIGVKTFWMLKKSMKIRQTKRKRRKKKRNEYS